MAGAKGGASAAVLPIALVAAIGFGGGFAAASWTGGPGETVEPESPAPSGEPKLVAYEEAEGARQVVPLPSIVTNLRAPTEAWVRLELAAVFAGRPVASHVDAIHADALALMRSLSVREIASPSAFLFLRAELRERARTLTEGAVTDVLVRGFLIE